MYFPLDMSASDTLASSQTEAVKTTSRYAASLSVVVNPYPKKKKKDQRPGRINCLESAALISILARFARGALW
jgi:hypothetical protein